MTDSVVYDYTPDTSEALDIMGADWFSWGTVDMLAAWYALSIDPDGEYPDLAQQIAEEMRDDPAFSSNMLLLNDVLAEEGGDVELPPDSEAQGVIDWINDWMSGTMSDVLGVSVPGILEDQIKSITEQYTNASRAVNDNIPQGIRQAFENVTGLGKMFGSLMHGLDVLNVYNTVKESNFDPKVMYQEYLSWYTAAVAIAATPLIVGTSPAWGIVLGVGLFAGIVGKTLASPIVAGFEAAGHALGNAILAVQAAANALWEATTQAAIVTADAISQAIDAAIDTGADFVDAVHQTMNNIYQNISQGLSDALDAVVATGEMSAEAAADVMESINKTMEGLINSAVESAVDAYNAAVAAGENIAETISNIANDLANGFNQVLGQLGQVFESMADAVLDVSGVVNDAMNAALEALNNLFDDIGWAAGKALDGLADWLEDVLGQFFSAFTEASPLVVDLGEQGIDLSGTVYWDIDQDGMAEATAWTSGEDGLLAYDRNGDGAIDNHGELFGTEVDDGFLRLAEFDTNGDGVIDANDTAFNDLIVWVDANSDGYSQEWEMFSLTDLGITEINLNAAANDNDISILRKVA